MTSAMILVSPDCYVDAQHLVSVDVRAAETPIRIRVMWESAGAVREIYVPCKDLEEAQATVLAIAHRANLARGANMLAAQYGQPTYNPFLEEQPIPTKGVE
jgi:hypothetical protein